MELSEGTIPLSEEEAAALATISELVGYSRTEEEQIQAEDSFGNIWLVNGSKVERVG